MSTWTVIPWKTETSHKGNAITGTMAVPWKAFVAVCILQVAVCAHAFVGVPPPTLLGNPGATCARAHRASSLVCLKAQLTATELPTAEAFTTLANAKLRKVRLGIVWWVG